MEKGVLKGKKIAFIANTAWSMYNFRQGLIKMLVAAKTEVYVIAPYDEYAHKLEALGVRFKRLLRLHAQGVNPLNDYLLYKELKNTLCAIHPDFLFTYTVKPNIYGVLAASTLNIPVVAVVTGLGHGFSKGGVITYAIKKLYRFSLKRASKIWFLNNDDLAYFVANGILNETKLKLIPGEGIDLEYFKRHSPYPENVPVKFLYSGRMLYEKGVADFVNAVAELKNKGRCVVGELLGFTDTENPSAITLEIVKSWESQNIIRYLGTTDDVRLYLEQTNCLVFPSYYSEGVPRCLLEAASMEVPAITTDSTGCRDVVEDQKTGYLTKPKDVEHLVKKMEAFMELSLADKVEMGKKARIKVQKSFSEEQVLKIYVHQIGEIAKDQR